MGNVKYTTGYIIVKTPVLRVPGTIVLGEICYSVHVLNMRERKYVLT